MYCIQSAAVLDFVGLQKSDSLLRVVVIMCAFTVYDIISSCVSFSSSFKVCEEMFIVNFTSLEGSPKLNSSNFTVKHPYSTVQINVCVLVALDMPLSFNMAFTIPSAIIWNSACNPDPCALYIQSNQENSLFGENLLFSAQSFWGLLIHLG